MIFSVDISLTGLAASVDGLPYLFWSHIYPTPTLIIYQTHTERNQNSAIDIFYEMIYHLINSTLDVAVGERQNSEIVSETDEVWAGQITLPTAERPEYGIVN
jgi:hypothetical protein